MSEAETTDTASFETLAVDNGWEWAIVEIMGHRTHAGRVREEERFGSKMLRIDIPVDGDAAANGWKTHYYSGQSIFSFTLTTEEVVIAKNKPWELPARYSLPNLSGADDDLDDERENDEADL